jgi:hypothetical protein
LQGEYAHRPRPDDAVVPAFLDAHPAAVVGRISRPRASAPYVFDNADRAIRTR